MGTRIGIVAALVFGLGCSAEVARDVDAGVPDAGAVDAGASGCEAGFACLVFTVDDRATPRFTNETVLRAKGNFQETSPGVIVADPMWAGPWPRLLDDGPAPAGHEAPDAIAGDHLWSVEVRVAVPSEPTVFEFGILQDDNWIWAGTNGKVEVGPSSSGELLLAPRLTLPAAGDVDVRWVLDTTDLASPEGFPSKTPVQLSTSWIGWLQLPCNDDGLEGDATANDDRWTCLLSAYVGPGRSLEDRMLPACDDPLTFVFTVGESGTEYRVGTIAQSQGVQVATRRGNGEFVERTVGLSGADLLLAPVGCDD